MRKRCGTNTLWWLCELSGSHGNDVLLAATCSAPSSPPLSLVVLGQRHILHIFSVSSTAAQSPWPSDAWHHKDAIIVLQVPRAQ